MSKQRERTEPENGNSHLARKRGKLESKIRRRKEKRIASWWFTPTRSGGSSVNDMSQYIFWAGDKKFQRHVPNSSRLKTL